VIDVEHALDRDRRLLPLLLLLLPLLLLVALLVLVALLLSLLLRRRSRLRLLRSAFGRRRGLLQALDGRRRGRRDVAIGRRLLRLLRRGDVAVRRRGLFRALAAFVVLHVDDAALRIQRRLHLVLPVLPAALASATATASPLPAEPPTPAAFALLALAALLLAVVTARAHPVLTWLRIFGISRLGRIGALGLRRGGGTLSFTIHRLLQFATSSAGG